MSAVEQITQALDEAEKRLDAATAGPWEVVPAYNRAYIARAARPATMTTRYHPAEALTWFVEDGDVLSVPDADLIVSVVNRERAQITFARGLLDRHQGYKDGSPWCRQCDPAQLNPCPTVRALLAVWCPS